MAGRGKGEWGVRAAIDGQAGEQTGRVKLGGKSDMSV